MYHHFLHFLGTFRSKDPQRSTATVLQAAAAARAARGEGDGDVSDVSDVFDVGRCETWLKPRKP